MIWCVEEYRSQLVLGIMKLHLTMQKWPVELKLKVCNLTSINFWKLYITFKSYHTPTTAQKKHDNLEDAMDFLNGIASDSLSLHLDGDSANDGKFLYGKLHLEVFHPSHVSEFHQKN